MATKVYQVNDENVTFCSNPLPLPENLVLVAEVDGNLETAFRETNSCEEAWYECDSPILKVIKEARSTSVGDIMELDGKVYVVASVGFTELEDYKIPVPA